MFMININNELLINMIIDFSNNSQIILIRGE